MTIKSLLARTAGSILGLNICRVGSVYKIYEEEQVSRFLHEFEIDCVFDVGANVGQYGMMLREIGYKGLIFSFEPNPSALKTLNAAAESDAKWIVFDRALDSEKRTVKFNITSSSEFSSLLKPSDQGQMLFKEQTQIEKTIDVETETLSVICPLLNTQHKFTRPFLKMDTQGNDRAVAIGAGDQLSKFVGLQSELALTQLYDNSVGIAEALSFYQSRGFRLSALVPNNSGHFPNLHEVDCIMYNPAYTTNADRAAET